MTVSKPLSIVLQLTSLGMIVSAYLDYQTGDTTSAFTTFVFALVILLISRNKTPRNN